MKLYPLGKARKGPLHACPKMLLLALAAALLCTSTAPSASSLGSACSCAGTTNSSFNSIHVPSPQQSSETNPSCLSHPSQAAPEPLLPFQVLQQEEEGDEVGVRQRAEKVHHAVLLGSRI